MLTWNENLYLGKNVKNKADRYIKKLNQGKAVPGIYLITLSSNPNDQLDIISGVFFLQKKLFVNLPLIVGLAKDYEEALKVLEEITADALRNANTCDLRSFLTKG